MTISNDRQPYTPVFYESHGDGSLRSARVILSELFLLCEVPQAVVDVGCGVGTWLLAAREQGVTEYLGLDGDWVPIEQLAIPPEYYFACDISAGPSLLNSLPKRRFDLVISMEVAEHLPPHKASQFVSFLCELGDLVLFSAAIPGQGGCNHLNEAWPAQWAELFARHKFVCFDLLRSRIWMNPEVDWWYAQNALIFARSESQVLPRLSRVAVAVDTPLPLVHPGKLLHLQHELILQMDGALKQISTLKADVTRLGAIEENSGNLAHALNRVSAERDVALRAAREWKEKTLSILASWSWRVTAPLRWIADFFRGWRTRIIVSNGSRRRLKLVTTAQSLMRSFKCDSRRISRKVSVSVVINTCNRAATLSKTLEAFRRQTYSEFEVVVVNGPSTDATDALLKQYAPDIKIACCRDRKLGISRNIGINIAAGDIVAFIDDDAVPEVTWLEKLAVVYTDPLVGAVGGYVFDIPTGRILWRICTCSRTGEVSTDAVPPPETYLGTGADPFLYLAGCNMSFRRSTLLAIGGFNESILYVYDDVDTCCRIVDKGHKIALVEGALVYHERAQNTIRDDRNVIRDCYPLIHDRAVFSLQCRTDRYSVQDLVSRIKETANYWRNAAGQHVDQGMFTAAEYEGFIRRIDDAVRDGIAQGLRHRTLRKFGAPRRTAFHPYPRYQAPTRQNCV